MANTDNPHGLRPLGRTFEGAQPRVMEFSKDAAQATAIFQHDAVSLEADGNLAPGGTPGTTRYHGVALHHGAALTLTTHLVDVSPSSVFEAQDNAVSAGIVAASIGLLANLELNAGSATTLLSGHEINETGIAVTATLDVKLIQLFNVQGNAFGPNARIEVLINKHFFREGAGI